MDANVKLKVGLDSLKKAKSYIRDSNYGRAFAHYLVFFELVDVQEQEYEKQFTETLCIWGKLLEERNQIENLCKCYLQALNYFPLSVEILNNFGAHLIRIEEYEEAKKYLQLAHNLAPHFLPAEKHLMTVKGELIERWHFPMLNDYERNMAYYKAILSYTAEGMARVIDIGTGCGLLSLYASNNENVKSIHAIEKSKTISAIANDIFNENNKTKVKLHNKHSNELSVADIDGYANLLITEIFDVGLFGENVLETLIHAWEYMLDKNAKVIPASASLYITGIQSLDISKKYRLVNTYQELKIENICLSVDNEEPYDSINLKYLSYKPLTETKNILNVDFSNLTQLKDLQLNKSHLIFQTLKIISSGYIDAFALWFDLHLDNNNLITTNPIRGNVNCWEQAITFVNHPSICKVDSDINIKVQCCKGRLEVGFADREITCTGCLKASSETITFLNDEVLISTIDKLYEPTLHNRSILDTFPFPYLGLKYAKNNNKCYCVVKNNRDKLFIEYICHINNISRENITIMEEKMLSYVITSKAYKFDMILLDPICKNGTVNENCLLSYNFYKKCLNPKGVIYPKFLNLICQVIESDYLYNFNVVNDENLFGFHIADHINQYSVNEHFNLDKNFQHRKLSSPRNIGNILFKDNNSPIIRRNQCKILTSKADGILYWFEFIFSNAVSVDTSLCSYYNFACFLIDRHENKTDNCELTLCVKQHRGLIKIYFEA